MNTHTQARGKNGIVLFFLTLVTTVVIAVGLIWSTTSDMASDWAAGLKSDISWPQNITGNAHSLPHGQIEEHVRESQEALDEHVRQSQERLNDFLNRN